MKNVSLFLKKIIPRGLYYWYVAYSRKHLSQFGQDFWIFGEVFNGKMNGYFVEIGSADGININNTFLLESKYRWRGICVEASPTYFETLKKTRRAVCLNVCIDSQEGFINFYNDGLTSGIISEETDNKTSNRANEENIVRLETKKLETILKSCNSPNIIDYLSIDVEGAEERILSNFPFDKYRFNSITIERPSKALRAILVENKYVPIKDIPGADVFYLHSDFFDEYSTNMNGYWKKNKS